MNKWAPVSACRAPPKRKNIYTDVLEHNDVIKYCYVSISTVRFSEHHGSLSLMFSIR